MNPSFNERAENAIPVNIRMISGCRDDQTSADVSNIAEFELPNPAGLAAGAGTSAFLNVVYADDKKPDDDLSFQDVLMKIRGILSEGGYAQIPQLSSSRPLDVETKFDLSPENFTGTKRAVLIGINYVGSRYDELSGCHNDALHANEYIKNVHGFDDDNITVLMDDGKHTNPTRENIMAAYSKITTESKPGDVVYLHYAGHGSNVKDKNGDESDGKDEVLCPVDFRKAGFIVDDDLLKFLVAKFKRDVFVTSIMDCCNSGTILDLPYNFKADGNQTAMVPEEDYNFDNIISTVVTMSGYDPTFTGVNIPLPTFADGDTLLKKQSPFFDQECWRKYIHYSVATNKLRRQPICVALNIDQKLLKLGADRDKDWTCDNEIGDQFQLDNDYYKKNDWDRGHMARFATSAWGETEKDAKDAGDATMFYSNSCLQHKNLNRDEWLGIEDWVINLTESTNYKVSSFSGPIYNDIEGVPARTVTPWGRIPAEVPAAFYKIVAFVDKSGKISTRAFIVLQDSSIIADAKGRKKLKNFQTFQVTTAMVEKKTGLIFHESLKTSNPMKTDFAPVGSGDDIVNGDVSPPKGDYSQVIIAAALINPVGKDYTSEWVSIANYSPQQVNLDGWTLSNKGRTPYNLSGFLGCGDTLRLNPRKRGRDGGTVILNNIKGSMSLKDPHGNVIDVAHWDRPGEGEVTIFDP